MNIFKEHHATFTMGISVSINYPFNKAPIIKGSIKQFKKITNGSWRKIKDKRQLVKEAIIGPLTIKTFIAWETFIQSKKKAIHYKMAVKNGLLSTWDTYEWTLGWFHTNSSASKARSDFEI